MSLGAAGDALQLLEPLLKREQESNTRAQREYEQQLKTKDDEQPAPSEPQLVDMLILKIITATQIQQLPEPMTEEQITIPLLPQPQQEHRKLPFQAIQYLKHNLQFHPHLHIQ